MPRRTGFWLIYAVAVLACVAGSIVWHLDEAPGGTLTVFLTPIALTACLIYGGILQRGDADTPLRIVDDIAAALVLGSADDGDADGTFVPDRAGDVDRAAHASAGRPRASRRPSASCWPASACGSGLRVGAE